MLKMDFSFSKKEEINTLEITGWPKCTDCTDFFSNCMDCTDFYPGNAPGFFFNFHSFQQVFHENFKKKSRQNEVSLTYFLHFK